MRYALPIFFTTFFLCFCYVLLTTHYVYMTEDKQGDNTHSNLQENEWKPNWDLRYPLRETRGNNKIEDKARDLTDVDLHRTDVVGNSSLQWKAKRRNDMLKASLRRTCALLNISVPVGDYHLDHIHVDDKNKWLYCYVPKVACTSWKRIWMKLTGVVGPTTDISTIGRYTVHTSLPRLLSLKYKNSATSILKTYKKFMFTRHPFDRVLSAFKDKLESEDKQSGYDFHDHVGKKIQQMYRGHEAGGHEVTFSEFIRFISEPGQGSDEQRNEHWLPVHEVCNPCAIDYDFIGKYENLEEDSEYILRWMGATDLVGSFPAADRPFHALRYETHYFDTLTREEKLAFFSKYMVDFLAFDYDFL